MTAMERRLERASRLAFIGFCVGVSATLLCLVDGWMQTGLLAYIGAFLSAIGAIVLAGGAVAILMEKDRS